MNPPSTPPRGRARRNAISIVPSSPPSFTKGGRGAIHGFLRHATSIQDMQICPLAVREEAKESPMCVDIAEIPVHILQQSLANFSFPTHSPSSYASSSSEFYRDGSGSCAALGLDGGCGEDIANQTLLLVQVIPHPRSRLRPMKARRWTHEWTRIWITYPNSIWSSRGMRNPKLEGSGTSTSQFNSSFSLVTIPYTFDTFQLPSESRYCAWSSCNDGLESK
ncbi:hypothetical protein EVG20_g1893 [Dentipellis fragilis]|uniref:Uncharacterized protein n=1 Tax=Dentipellis fragilis TaxID=205917 RepID=A0A4Y9ZAV2_9AGAM|nr:hypothetical protein EVG20_g1893 [Dentipellis fragilis]